VSETVTDLDALDLRLAHSSGLASFDAKRSITKALDGCIADPELSELIDDPDAIRKAINDESEALLALCRSELENVLLAARVVNEEVFARGLSNQFDPSREISGLRDLFRATAGAAAEIARTREARIRPPERSDSERPIAAERAAKIDTELDELVAALSPYLET
jgi:hypothetical protein